MKKPMKKLVIILPTLIISGIAFAQFTPGLVGGDGAVGYGITSPYAPLGYLSTDDFIKARANGYQQNKTDADLWDHAKKSIHGNVKQIIGSSESYGDVYINLGGKNGISVSKAAFAPIFSCTVAVGTSGFAAFSDCTNAMSKQYTLSDHALWAEAKAASAALQLFCGEVACTTLIKSAFQAAKTNKSSFDIDKARGSNGTMRGRLTSADFITHGAAFPASFNTATRRSWLIAYLNDAANQSGGTMAGAAHPTRPASSTATWQARAAALNLDGVALWVIQQIQTSNLPKSNLSSDVFASAGIGSGYISALTLSRASTAIDNAAATSASDVVNVASIQNWLSGLITTNWDATPNTSITKNDTQVNGINVAIVTSSATPGGANIGGGNSVSYSLAGSDAASFAVSTSGVIVTAAALRAGSHSFTLHATPSIGNPITKSFTVTILDATNPVFVSAATASAFASNVSPATVLYTAAATDTGSAISYTISGLAGLSINSTNGKVVRVGTVAAGVNQRFTVRASDAAGNYSDRIVTIPTIPFGYSQKKAVSGKCGTGCCAGDGWQMAPKSVVDSGAFDTFTYGYGYGGSAYVAEGRFKHPGWPDQKSIALMRTGIWSTVTHNGKCLVSSNCVSLCVK